jgi:hypothetical protein
MPSPVKTIDDDGRLVTKRPMPVFDTTKVMLARGQLVGPADFQRLMRWTSPKTVRKAIAEGRVFFVEHESERYFPVFFSDSSFGRAQVQAVARILRDLPAGSRMQFFLTAKGSLGGKTPLQALTAGKFVSVKDVAAAFAEVR